MNWNQNQQPPAAQPPAAQSPQGQWNQPPAPVQPPQGQWNQPPAAQSPQGQWNQPPAPVQPPQGQWTGNQQANNSGGGYDGQNKKTHIGKGKPANSQWVLANLFFNIAQIPLQWIRMKNSTNNPNVEAAFQAFMQALQNLQQVISQQGGQWDGPQVRVSVKNMRQADRAGNTLTMYINEFIPQPQGQRNQAQGQWNQ
jgi:hypothetical protein